MNERSAEALRAAKGERPVRIAIDANILVQDAPRRLVFGAAEMAGFDVIVPETAALMAASVYPRVLLRTINRQISHEYGGRTPPLSEMDTAKLIAERLEEASTGFQKWLDDEPRRNDGAFTIGPRTPAARQTAIELYRAGVVDDPEDDRWGIGEDPYALAEALEAGAHWVATDNFHTLDHKTMEEWLDSAQATGRYLHVPRPFSIGGEGALTTTLGARAWIDMGDWAVANQERLMLANAVSRPNRTDAGTSERLDVLQCFAKSIRRSGFRRTGRSIEQWCQNHRRKVEHGRLAETDTEKAFQQLDRHLPASRVSKTREAEDRRLPLERKRVQQAAKRDRAVATTD